MYIHSRRKSKSFVQKILRVISALGIFLLIGYVCFLFLPVYVSDDIRVTIPSGYSLTASAEPLKNSGVIRSPLLFQIFGRVQNLSVKAGSYLFEEGVYSIFDVLKRLHTGEYGDVFAVTTFAEGITINQMADILDAQERLTAFDREEFLRLTKDQEGYLFPDTYLFLPEMTTEEIVATLKENFQKKVIDVYGEDINASGKSLKEIIIMASLLEKESGPDPEEQKIVSGILWKRLSEGMLLQVDAPFVYYQGKGSAQLTTNDLRTDHPYNTYTRRGLPPTPIGNPGVSSIDAAMHPQNSLYFFYLHDKKGAVHYATTHDEHVKNKQRYLN